MTVRRMVAAAAVAAAAAGSAVLTAPAAHALTPTSMTIARSSQSLTFGDSETLTGKLSILSGVLPIPLPLAPVLLQGRTHGNTVWGTIATKNTGPDGTVSFTHTPGGHADYRLVYAGDLLDNPAESAAAIVYVKPRFTAAASRSGDVVTVRGGLAPAPSGQGIWLEQYTRTGWRGIQKHPVAGSYSFSMRLSPGITRLRVNRPADRTHLAVLSPVYTFTK